MVVINVKTDGVTWYTSKFLIKKYSISFHSVQSRDIHHSIDIKKSKPKHNTKSEKKKKLISLAGKVFISMILFSTELRQKVLNLFKLLSKRNEGSEIFSEMFTYT